MTIAESNHQIREDVPLFHVKVRTELREEAFTILSSHDYFTDHEKKWWIQQLNDIEIMREETQNAVTRKGETGVPKRKGIVQELEEDTRTDDDKSEIDFEMLEKDGERSEGEGKELSGAEMMEVDEAELTDEDIEDISSDVELYGKDAKWRADSHQDV